MQQETCDLCEKIYDVEELRNTYWSEREYSNYITHNEEHDSYHLWHECDDSYYSGTIMEIGYCPVCGRKLSDV